MEYKIKIAGIPNVDLYADQTSAQNFVASVSGTTAAKRLVAYNQFSDKLINVKKVGKKVAAKKTAIKEPKAIKTKRKK